MSTDRIPEFWRRWHASPWYLRAAVWAVYISAGAMAVAVMAFDGEALSGYVKDGHYFLGHKNNSRTHEVSFGAWATSWAVNLAFVVSWVIVVIALAVTRFRNRRRA